MSLSQYLRALLVESSPLRRNVQSPHRSCSVAISSLLCKQCEHSASQEKQGNNQPSPLFSSPSASSIHQFDLVYLLNRPQSRVILHHQSAPDPLVSLTG